MAKTRVGLFILNGTLFSVCLVLQTVVAPNTHAAFLVPFDPLTQSYTYVRIETNPFNGLERIGEANLASQTSYTDSIIAENAVGAYAGQVDGSGLAKFTSLGAKVEVFDGTGTFTGFTEAGANEIFTVLPPAGVTPGTPGTMSLNFRLDGETIVDYNDAILGDDRVNGTLHQFSPTFLAILRFSVWQRTVPPTPAVQENRALMYLDDLPTGAVATGGPHNAVLSHALLSANVDFNYGEPFAVTTLLRVDGYVDGGTGSADSDYLNKVTVDFLNTARLVAIINEEHPDAQVIGLGGESYQNLVMNEVPSIPVPAAGWLLGSAWLLPVGRRRPGKATVTMRSD